MKKQIVLSVKDVSDRIRLDTYIASVLDITRSKIKKLIESDHVTIDNEVRNCHHNVINGEIIRIYFIENAHRQIPQQIKLKIIYEAPNYVIIDKPPGLVVHPGIKQKDNTLLNGLVAKYDSPLIVHRLDKDTSGVMVVALDESTALSLREQFKKRTVKKVYLALVEGILKEDSGEISAPLRRSRRDPRKMSVSWVGARESVTRFKVRKRFNNAVFIEVFPLSGRTHQIRVHFAYYDIPIIGDIKYADHMSYKADRQMLHAWQIAFLDPLSDKRVHYEASIPEDFQSMIDRLA